MRGFKIDDLIPLKIEDIPNWPNTIRENFEVSLMFSKIDHFDGLVYQ